MMKARREGGLQIAKGAFPLALKYCEGPSFDNGLLGLKRVVENLLEDGPVDLFCISSYNSSVPTKQETHFHLSEIYIFQ